MTTARKSSGFTLVEVMVALVIMSMMALLAWRGLDALLNSRDRAQEHLDQSIRLQAVLEQWELDLRALQDVNVVPALAFDGATLRVTRQQPAGMQVVAWSVRNGALYRWEGPVVQTVAALEESFQRSGQLQAQDSAQLRALAGVSGWQMYYYRGNSWSNALSSGAGGVSTGSISAATAAAAAAAAAPQASGVNLTPNPNPTAMTLPTGVRMLLQLDDSSGLAGPVTREIVLGPQP